MPAAAAAAVAGATTLFHIRIQDHWCWSGGGDSPAKDPFACCDPAFGPTGNVSCWGTPHWHTYANCCVGLPLLAPHSRSIQQEVLFPMFFQYLESAWGQGDVDGDYVELGVWQGRSAAIAAKSMLNLGLPRMLWLYDSWQGLPPATLRDGAYAGTRTGTLRGGAATPRAVRSRVLSTGYPPQLLQIRQGFFNVSLPRSIESGDIARGVAFLHLDCDWYESTMQGLETFYDRVPSGGLVVIDDFGYWEGARLAFYDFFARRREYPLLERAGHSVAWFIKGRVHSRERGILG